MTKDSDDFGAEMAKAGVLPLKGHREKPALRPPRKDLNTAILRKAASSELSRENDPFHYQGVEWLGPYDIVEFRRPGIKHESFKKLKRGNYDIGADLDLHNYHLDEAKIALFQFIRSSIVQNIRCAIVVHGKGWHTSAKPAEGELCNNHTKQASPMKSHVVHWLKSINEVLAVSSAQPKDGGTGAVYVLFKSSSR